MRIDRDAAAALRLLDELRRHPLARRRVRLSRAYLRAVARAEELALGDRDKTWVFEALRRASRLRARGRWR